MITSPAIEPKAHWLHAAALELSGVTTTRRNKPAYVQRARVQRADPEGLACVVCQRRIEAVKVVRQPAVTTCHAQQASCHPGRQPWSECKIERRERAFELTKRCLKNRRALRAFNKHTAHRLQTKQMVDWSSARGGRRFLPSRAGG